FEEIHCVTFGAPPVASKPIAEIRGNATNFFAIINEGDPVPLAQEEYIKSLLSIYVLSKEAFENAYPDPPGYIVPTPKLRVSGPCLVLRDVDPDDPDETAIAAVDVEAKHLESRMFGNFLLHSLSIYIKRIEQLAN
ncbi:MAG: hypothetical protein Q9160_009180, partial [Pyrenula sp. 1 TL-2023]